MNALELPGPTPIDLAEQYRVSVLSRFKEEEFQHLLRADLLLAQSVAGHGDEWGIWKVPPEISPRRSKPSLRSVNLAQRLHDYLSKEPVTSSLVEELVKDGVLLLTRLALLLRLAPSSGQGNNKSKRLKITTLSHHLYLYWPKILARAIARKAMRPDAEGLLGCLTEEDVRAMRQSKVMRAELHRIDILAARGLWTDLPPQLDITRTTNPNGLIQVRTLEEVPKEYQPIPVEYLAEIGPRVLWLIRELGPHLLVLLEGLTVYLTSLDWTGMDKAKIRRRVEKFISAHLHEHPWTDRAGKPLIPPFPLTTAKIIQQGTNDTREWPPRTWNHLKTLSTTLQSAHLFLSLLATGGRIGEVFTLASNCVACARDGQDYLRGWTYKLSGNLFGDRRQWPAPALLVQSLGQQARLAAAWGRLPPGALEAGLPAAPPTHNALWLSLGTSASSRPDSPLGTPHYALLRLAKCVGMDPKPGGINLHPHRFRKTIGRLAGIALFNSPLVLKRLFGHKSIEMTLHYILCDDDVRTEAEKVLRELRILNCAEALEEIREALASGAPLPGHGGPPAARLVEAIKAEEVRLAQSNRLWTEGSAYDLAYLMTANGQGWRFIQKNIVCTKVPGEDGLCRKKRNRGEPDTSNCKQECSNRLVLARERRNIEEIAESYLDVARQAKEGEQFLVLFEAMQRFSEELEAFADLKAHYLSDPEVLSLLSSCEEATK